jgi:hypothetical protein
MKPTVKGLVGADPKHIAAFKGGIIIKSPEALQLLAQLRREPGSVYHEGDSHGGQHITMKRTRLSPYTVVSEGEFFEGKTKRRITRIRFSNGETVELVE